MLLKELQGVKTADGPLLVQTSVRLVEKPLRSDILSLTGGRLAGARPLSHTLHMLLLLIWVLIETIG